jgi:hypothetical protein
MSIWLLITNDHQHDPSRPDLSWDGRCKAVSRISVGGTHLTMLASPTRDIVVAELMRLDGALYPEGAPQRQTALDEIARPGGEGVHHASVKNSGDACRQIV